MFPAGSGPTFSQKIFVFDSPSLAKAAYDAAIGILKDCRQAQGEYPQTGSVIINDGINTAKVDVTEVRQISDTATLLQGAPSYDGSVEEMSAFILADASVIWLNSYNFNDTLSEEKFLAKFDQYVNDAQTYALTGEVPPSAPEANTGLTLDCLQIEPKPYKLLKNYDQYSGRGQGNDLFIEQQFAVTNNCGKAVRAFKYDVAFTDEFGDNVEGLYGSNGSDKMTIQPGQARLTPKNQGWILNSFGEEGAGIKTMLAAAPGDITVKATATLIRFNDATTLP
jgi:hypothetical protein